MTAGPFADPETRSAQRRAADPQTSAWVSANAGAGKTKVLTDRVVRLLLSGSPPGRILCLTFTKAAAANMAIRVFDRLGRWVTLPEPALAAELADLTGEPPRPDTLRFARRLFARAVETPGGLKFETLHAFCERLLHLVPFEANVPAGFVVLDDARSDELLAAAIDETLAEAASGRRPDLSEALSLVGAEAAGDVLRSAIRAAVSESAVHEPEALSAALRRALALGPDETPERIERRMLVDGFGPADWPAAAAALRATGKATDAKRATDLEAAAVAPTGSEQLERFLAVFFGQVGRPRAVSAFITKAVAPLWRNALLAERERLEAVEGRLRAARTAERTRALFVLGSDVHRRVEASKSRQGALDFDDLVSKALALLDRGDAGWLLYKLDRGIDHILLDEAQDTNSRQWAILRRITEEFTAGRGARSGAGRTLFAVGNPKQSIYSFQGAAPHAFGNNRRFWRTRTLDAEGRFEDVRLELSFRSVSAVLSVVDETFGHPAHYKGLSFEDDVVGTIHRTARPQALGLVELWPTELRVDEPARDAWTPPPDGREPSSPAVQVAARVAKAVKRWTTEGDEWGRVRRAGDILILVKTRGPAFEAVIRALWEAGVAVAGQDRLDVSAHLAVLDLVSAGRAALLPDDDLTLASALKTPLVDLTDDELLRIAADRAPYEPLAAALRRHADGGDPAARSGLAALDGWRALAAKHGPFGFYAALLGPGGGRAALLSRLGGEAGDAADVFLSAAREAETGPDAPSLLAFLARYEAAALGDGTGHTVKRDLETGRDEVRVMTVHGSKGLEAPVVVLLDGCDVREREPVLVPFRWMNRDLPVWSPRKDEDCPAVAEARAAGHALARDEHNRLLYVAMTRAADRLVIAPYWSGPNEAPETAWCEMVRRSLTKEAGGLVREEAPHGPVLVWREGEGGGAVAAVSVEPKAPPAVPDWLRRAVPPEPEPAAPLRPSSALAAADRPDRIFVRAGPELRSSATDVRRRGVLAHALLERLPAVAPERRAETARDYLAARAPGLPENARERIAADALGVLADARLFSLWGPGSRAEAAIAGRVRIGGSEIAVSGRIDRVVLGEREVLLADYKTGARPADGSVPKADAAQLALYRALLLDIHPERVVRAFLVWTEGPTVREVTGAELDAALAAVPMMS